MSLKDRLNAKINNQDQYKQQQNQEFTLGTTFSKSAISNTNDFGPLDSLMTDPNISAIFVNNAKNIYIEKEGKLYKSDITLKDNQQVKTILKGLAYNVGKKIDDCSPVLNAKLSDGSLITAVIAHATVEESCFSIRKYNAEVRILENLSKFGTLSEEMAKVLALAVKAKLNIVISGGVDSGKTSLLNALSSLVPNDERIITIEDSAQLSLSQENIIRIETCQANKDLLASVLRMNPDRIIADECFDSETLNTLQTLNTKHNSFFATLYSNSTNFALKRLETTSQLDLIIQMDKLQDGSRKITSVSEIINNQGSAISTQELFHYEEATKQHHSTGIIPKFVEKIKEKNLSIALEYFDKSTNHNYKTAISTIKPADLPKAVKNTPAKKRATKINEAATAHQGLSQRFKNS